MNLSRTKRTGLHSATRSAQLCRLAGCLSALALALPAALNAQEMAAPAPEATPAPAAAPAAAEGTGTISGRVLNAGTGMYLSKAVVTVKGTNLQTLTSDYGDFDISGLPAGTTTLEITYTGLVPQSVDVSVEAGKATTTEIKLSRSRLSDTPKDKETVALEEFVVETERFKSAAEIAINEERYSTTIKNVIAADAFGDIPEGNIGEFVKFIPGVQVSYGGTYTSDADATGIGVRGFGPEDTAIMIDGVPVSSANPGSLTRAVTLDMLSINNASRVEVIKVPTPDMPSNSVGGQINLVTKRASEYARPEFSYRLFTSVNSDYPDFMKKSPGPANKNTQKVRPGADFSWIFPVNNKFGFTITAATSNQFNPNNRVAFEWQALPTTTDLRAYGGLNSTPNDNANGVASLANPHLKKVNFTDAPRFSDRHSVGINFDWKPNSSNVLLFSYGYSIYDSVDAQRSISFSVEKPADWGADFVTGIPYLRKYIGSTQFTTDAGNKMAMVIDTRDKSGDTHTAYIKHTFDWRGWKLDTLGSISIAEGSYKDMENGHFSGLDMKVDAGQVTFDGIKNGIPSTIRTWDRVTTGTGTSAITQAGNEVDYTILDNWKLDSFKAKSGLALSRDTNYVFQTDLSREIDFLPWSNAVPMTFKTGFKRDSKKVEKWGRGTGYTMTYVGPALATGDYIDDYYQGISPGYGARPQQWASTYKVYELYKQHPEYFNPNEASAVIGNYNSYVNQQKSLEDRKDAWYAMLSGRALKNKLSFVGGLRQEQSQLEGRGPFTDSKWWLVKNDDGTIYTDSVYTTGADIRKQTVIDDAALRSRLDALDIDLPTYIANTSSSAPIEQQLLARQKQLIANKAISVQKKGKPAYSASFAYNILTDLVGRVSWSRKFGQVAYEDSRSGILSGNGAFVVNENVPHTEDQGGSGNIKVANPNLQPSTSNDWDFSLSYYTKSGGKFGVSYYMKETKNFAETIRWYSDSAGYDEIMEVVGISPDSTGYDNWSIDTSVNGIGVEKTTGWEFDVDQKLDFLGKWGQYFRVFANYSKKETKPKVLSTGKTLPLTSNDTASAGIFFNSRKINISLKATYLDWTIKEKGSIAYNSLTYDYYKWAPSEIRYDLNARYNISKRYSVFLSARDVFNAGRKQYRFDSEGVMPSYARLIDMKEYGVQWNIGMSGRF